MHEEWLPPRDSNPDMLIQSPVTSVAGKEDKGLNSADSGKVVQNPQPTRNQEETASRHKTDLGGSPISLKGEK